MGIRIVNPRYWIGLAYLAAGLMVMPGAVQAQTVPSVPSVNLQCVASTILKGNTVAAGTSQPTCGQLWYSHPNGLAITLQDGSVLVAGGYDGTGMRPAYLSQAAEVYQPRDGLFLPVGQMAQLAIAPPAALLGNGQVLIVSTTPSGPPDSEVYNPTLQSFREVGALSTTRQDGFTLTAFGNTDALVAGGVQDTPGGATALAQAKVYNANSQAYSATGSLNQARFSAGAVELANGKVLVVGGHTGFDSHGCPVGTTASAEIYDPATGKFAPAGNMTSVRAGPHVIRLRDGRVLIVGGESAGGNCQLSVWTTAEIYDPVSGIFSATGSLVRNLPQNGDTLTSFNQPALMKNGKVLIGDEIYDPASGSFSLAAGVAAGDSRVMLKTGQALQLNSTISATLYQPPP